MKRQQHERHDPGRVLPPPFHVLLRPPSLCVGRGKRYFSSSGSQCVLTGIRLIGSEVSRLHAVKLSGRSGKNTFALKLNSETLRVKWSWRKVSVCVFLGGFSPESSQQYAWIWFKMQTGLFFPSSKSQTCDSGSGGSKHKGDDFTLEADSSFFFPRVTVNCIASHVKINSLLLTIFMKSKCSRIQAFLKWPFLPWRLMRHSRLPFINKSVA